jgi:hypothetical protein
MKFPFDIVLPMLPLKLTIGREKEPVVAPVTAPLASSDSTLSFDTKDAAIMFLGFALLFTVLAFLILALAKQSN